MNAVIEYVRKKEEEKQTDLRTQFTIMDDIRGILNQQATHAMGLKRGTVLGELRKASAPTAKFAIDPNVAAIAVWKKKEAWKYFHLFSCFICYCGF